MNLNKTYLNTKSYLSSHAQRQNLELSFVKIS